MEFTFVDKFSIKASAILLKVRKPIILSDKSNCSRHVFSRRNL